MQRHCGKKEFRFSVPVHNGSVLFVHTPVAWLISGVVV